MNIMFKVDGEIYTAPTVGTVLPGITRMSCIELLKKWGYKVHEERFTIDFIMDAAKTGKLEEVFTLKHRSRNQPRWRSDL